MAEQASSGAEARLTQVLEADRALRKAQEAFLAAGDEPKLVAAITREVDRLWGDDEEGVPALIRMADLLLDIGGAQGTKVLVRLMGHQEPAVRLAAGEGLVELGYQRYAEVARLIEAEFDKGTDVIALCELPFVLAELGEPGGVKITAKLLKHKDSDVVGAAIEALAQFGDPSVLKDIERLKGDKRVLSIDEDDEEASQVTVGELALEALEHLRSLGE